MGQLSYPLDSRDKQIIKDAVRLFLPDLVFDAIWNKYFYYFTFLESLNASAAQAADSGGDTEANITVPGSWDTATSGSASLSFGSAGCVLTTGATASSAAGIAKRPTSQSIIRLDKTQRFRTAFRVSSVTNQTAYLVRGGVAIAGASGKYYGFRISDSTLQGTVDNGGTRTNITLVTGLVADTTYDVEARLFPNEKVVFLVRNSTTGIYEEKGVQTLQSANGVPTGTTSTEFAEFYITNGAAENKQMTVSFFEYIQER